MRAVKGVSRRGDLGTDRLDLVGVADGGRGTGLRVLGIYVRGGETGSIL